jgi:predicted small lipoprotein YifL
MFGLKRILGRAIGPSRGMVIAMGVLCATVLAACGQRGPLYLPGPETQAPKKPTPAQTAPPDTPAIPVQR